MKIFALIMILSFAFAQSVSAINEGHGFPGKGEIKKWELANTKYNEGVQLYRTKSYDAAIAKFKGAIEEYPYDYEYFNNLGLCYKNLSKWSDAVEAYQKSIELKGNVWDNWSNLGSAYKHSGERSKALEAYEKSLQFNPPAAQKVLIEKNVKSLRENP